MKCRNDGLLIQTANTYQITPAGLPFIRNIAACFDPAYQRKKEGRQFSSAI
jgi:coproporphyrinogen III oxidase-like Fe-S oxidoreductase